MLNEAEAAPGGGEGLAMDLSSLPGVQKKGRQESGGDVGLGAWLGIIHI